MEPERIAGDGVEMKIGVGDLRQHDSAVVVDRFGHQQPGGLRHSLDDQGVRHQGHAREMVVHVLLGQRHVLHGRGMLPADEFLETVDPKPAHGTLSTGPPRGPHEAVAGEG